MMIRVLLSALCLTVFTTHPVLAELQGDPEAIALAERMIENIGGKERWSTVRTLYVIEKSRHPKYGDGLISEFWRDLQVPQERYSIQNENVEFSKGWTEEGGWTVAGGKLTPKTREQVAAEELKYWPGEIYVMYHRLAKGDPSVRLAKGEEDDQFIAWEDKSGQKLGTFWVNVDGDMYRWRHGDESDLTEYVYGPHVDFGDISFPAWGTMYDGSWSFSYVEVRALDTPPPISFEAPKD